MTTRMRLTRDEYLERARAESEPRLRRIASLRKQGFTAYQIAVHEGVSEQAITKALRKARARGYL